MKSQTISHGKHNSFTLHDIPICDRPRERLYHLGSHALSLTDLFAVLLGRGMKGESVMKLAGRIITTYPTLEQVMSASIDDLEKIRGVGRAKACQIHACIEMARRLTNQKVTEPKQGKKNISPDGIVHKVGSRMRALSKEQFVVVSLDTRCGFIAEDIVSVGTLNASIVHPRETFEPAIRRHAACIVLVHNHPSGDPTPSEEDIALTRRLSQAGGIMNIPVFDHIIIGSDSYYSLKEHGYIT